MGHRKVHSFYDMTVMIIPQLDYLKPSFIFMEAIEENFVLCRIFVGSYFDILKGDSLFHPSSADLGRLRVFINCLDIRGCICNGNLYSYYFIYIFTHILKVNKSK